MERESEKLACCLRDAGCGDEFVERFMNSSCASEKLGMLARRRAALLDALHADQRRLECLDYIIFSIRSDEKR